MGRIDQCGAVPRDLVRAGSYNAMRALNGSVVCAAWRTRQFNKMFPSVENELAQLRTIRNAHFAAALPLMRKGYSYKLDSLALAVLDRSLALLRGFCDLVEGRNMIAAAPLLRCQLDNGLRFFASTLVDDPHAFAGDIANGIPVYRMKDEHGNFMLDDYLKKRLTVEVPWVRALYDQASGYVHLSEQHIINTIGIPDEDGWTEIGITGCDGRVWTEQRYIEAIEAFDASTRLVLELVKMWSQVRREPRVPVEGDQS